MQIVENVPLSQYSTMRLGGTARYLCTVQNRHDVTDAVAWAIANQVPPLMIGAGSNILWRDDGFAGLVLVNAITGYEDFAEDEQNHYVTLGAGESWDSVVGRTVDAGLTGIEALSLVPGTVGATVIQNVGAYGQDIAQTLVSIEAYDLHTQSFITIPTSDCAFGYRTSRFKTTDRGRFFITGITVHLMRSNPVPPFYPAVQNYLNEHSLAPSPATIRAAVIDIRSRKLPDPVSVANAGSFFGNPIIPAADYARLAADYPDLPHWPTDDPALVKVAAAWLIEQVGLKNYHDPTTGMATWPNQPLVFVNEHAKHTADVLKFRDGVTQAVKNQFGITLEQEPELLP